MAKRRNGQELDEIWCISDDSEEENENIQDGSDDDMDRGYKI